MRPSSPIVFFGNERLSSGFDPHGAPTLEALVKAGYNIAAVVANFEVGRSRTARRLEIEEVAKKYSIPMLLPAKPGDIADNLRTHKPVAGVLVAYGKLIPQSVIDIFPAGIINIHPSLLPKYRGSTPIEQAILDGAPKTGVSLMKLVKEMDAGPIFGQAELKLTGDESKQELTEALLSLGGQLLLATLPKIIDGSAKGWAQNDAQATYTKLIDKQMGALKTSKTALQLEREVRAFAGWPKSRLDIFGHSVIVAKVRVVSSADEGELVIPCAQNSFLEILTLVAPSSRTMSGADFRRGYQNS